MIFDDKSKISITLAITLIGGGAAWMTSIALQGMANAKTLETLEIRQVRYNDSIQNIEKDLAIIRTKFEMFVNKGS